MTVRPADHSRVTLISFLGTGHYQQTRYIWPGVDERGVDTAYVAAALAVMGKVSTVVVLATEKARTLHEEGLTRACQEATGLIPRFEQLHEGRTSSDIWANFDVLVKLLRTPETSDLWLDITHAFRSLPLFTIAVLSFVRALDPTAAAVRVVYGAFEDRLSDNHTPIWDLTPVVDLIDWTHAIRQFVVTGHADGVVRLARRLGSALGKRWAQTGQQGDWPRVSQFADALEQFGSALATVRTGSLLLGERPNVPSAASRLARAVDLAKNDLETYAPPLARVLQEIKKMVEPLLLDQDHLAGDQGRQALAALAHLYWELGRYAEAAAVLREAWVTVYGGPEAARPGWQGYDPEARRQAERRWTSGHRDARGIAELRNDIEHAGFQTRPLPPDRIITGLKDKLSALERDAGPVDVPQAERVVTWFVTRHRGAREWAARKQLKVERVVEHLDPAQVQPGDLVMGTLPVHLAAEVCARGARYLHLSLEVPPAWRGRELSADELEQCAARIEEFQVRVVSPEVCE